MRAKRGGELVKMEDIITKVIQIAKEHPNNFTIGLVQRRLCLSYYKLLPVVKELEKRKIIGPVNNKTGMRPVLI